MQRVKRAQSTKRVVIVSDMHCGHLVGLTPKHWQVSAEKGKWRAKAAALEQECWDWYTNKIDSLKPINIVIANADLIDGRGEKSGSTELITSNRTLQAEMATTALKYAQAQHYVMTYGTPYHTGDTEDFEDIVAGSLREDPSVSSVKIGSHEWVDVNGCMFDCKHHIGNTQIPHGRFTAIARDQLWNDLWALHDEQPRADVIIRSHVHLHSYCGAEDWLALTTPALQAMGTKFGSRRCSGRVHFGLIHFDVAADGSYTWQAHIAQIKKQQATAVKL